MEIRTDDEKMMDILLQLLPIMVGPSSSHTCGAVRIGLSARDILADIPVEAKIQLSGSFARTGLGHRTDIALIGGILGLTPDNESIKYSFRLAREKGILFSFLLQDIPDAHPNTALIWLKGQRGRHVIVQGSSLGGGRIDIKEIQNEI